MNNGWPIDYSNEQFDLSVEDVIMGLESTLLSTTDDLQKQSITRRLGVLYAIKNRSMKSE